MNLFLDSSVVLAACGSETGASRFLFDNASSRGWVLHSSAYVVSEVDANLTRLSQSAAIVWPLLLKNLVLMPDVVSFHWESIFAPAKDRPILFTAAAWSDVLLTLDRRDFLDLLGSSFYGLPILKPGDFLQSKFVVVNK